MMNSYLSVHICDRIIFVKISQEYYLFDLTICCSVNMFLLRTETTCGASLLLAVRSSWQSAEKKNHFSKIFADADRRHQKN
jgi:hypothetical protein